MFVDLGIYQPGGSGDTIPITGKDSRHNLTVVSILWALAPAFLRPFDPKRKVLRVSQVSE